MLVLFTRETCETCEHSARVYSVAGGTRTPSGVVRSLFTNLKIDIYFSGAFPVFNRVILVLRVVLVN